MQVRLADMDVRHNVHGKGQQTSRRVSFNEIATWTRVPPLRSDDDAVIPAHTWQPASAPHMHLTCVRTYLLKNEEERKAHGVRAAEEAYQTDERIKKQLENIVREATSIQSQMHLDRLVNEDDEVMN